MRRIAMATCCASALFAGPPPVAADNVPKAEAAEIKAKALEEDTVAGDDKALPSKSEVITRPESQAVDPAGTEPLDEALVCLARTIYWETRGQDAASLEAVANVVMNRLGHAGFPNTVCEVVMQGREQGACQFSWWCDGRPDEAEDEKSYATAKEIARKALNRQLPDRTGGALYFHSENAAPQWAAEYVETAEIGKFVFYKPQGSTGK